MESSSGLSKNLRISGHTEATLHQLNEFRSSKHLCDVTVVVQGREFPAHRAVLAAVGGFFSGLFAANMREQTENIVHLNEVDPEIAEDLLRYIYTGAIELTKDNALSIVKAADFMLLEKLKAHVDEFLAEIAKDVSHDYLSNYRVAVQHRCPLFEKASLALVCKNFTAIFQSRAFLELGIEMLQEIIDSDGLEIGSEEVVFYAIVRWVKHQPTVRNDCFEQLFSLVRLCSLSEDFLQYVVLAEHLVLSNPDCLGHVIKSMRSKYVPTLAHGQHPRSCLDSYATALLVFPNKHRIPGPWCYIPSQEKWYQMPLKGVNTNSGYGRAVFHNGSILLVKSNKRHSRLCLDIDRYDPQTNTWSQPISIDVQGLYYARHYSVGCLKGIVYLIGGVSIAENINLNDVYACDITDDFVSKSTLTAAPSMAHQRSGASIVSDDKYLYVLGGMDKNIDTDNNTVLLESVERYDPEMKTWKLMSPMKNKSCFLQCTLAHGKIFASPGVMFSNLSRNFDEVYDIISDTWSEIPRSPQHFLAAAMTECDGKLYVIGNACPTLRDVEGNSEDVEGSAKDVEDNAKDHDLNKLYSTSFDLKKKSWSSVATISLKTNLAQISGMAVRLPKKNIAALQPLQVFNK